MGEKQKSRQFLDSLGKFEQGCRFFSANDFREIVKTAPAPVWFSKQGISDKFFTEDSKRYITPKEYSRIKSGQKMASFISRLDSAMDRDWSFKAGKRAGKRLSLAREARRSYFSLRNHAVKLIEDSWDSVPMAKMWNLSVVGAVILGMFTMTLVYRYLGQNVSAKMEVEANLNYSESVDVNSGGIIGANDPVDINDQIDTEYITRVIENENSGEKIENKDFENEIMGMVKGYPIEKMVPEIAKKDRIVAAFLVAIAKKESSWGVHVPVYEGQDCFNYWGYRGKNPVGTGGHSCFSSPEDAVDTVAKRIEYLVSETKRTTPDEMVVWKCGSDCRVTGGIPAANKWISDVDMYFQQLNKE